MKLATLCYVRANGHTLMLHRIKKQDDMHHGKWNGLGGKLDPGETPEECVIREVYEESGLKIVRPELRGFLTFPRFSDNEDWYVFVFVAREFLGELIESREGRLAWIHDDQLSELNLWEGDHIFLQWLEEERFFSGRFEYGQGKLTNHDVVFYTRDGVAAVEVKSSTDNGQKQNGFVPVYEPQDDTYCWICGGEVDKRHCKIVCLTCGFMRDCGDP